MAPSLPLLLLLGLSLLLVVSATFSQSDPVIGVDLGTTYASASYYNAEKEEVEMIPFAPNRHLIPSTVAILEKGYLVGEEARKQRTERPDRTFYDAKRLIGRDFDHPIVETLASKWPFKVASENGKAAFVVPGRGNLLPEQISALVLAEVRTAASNYLKSDVKRVFLTVPVTFDEGQRRATVTAARIAGFEEIKLVEEPVAAAVAYSTEKLFDTVGTIFLVCDFGGGTFDVTLAKVKSGGSVDILGKKGEVLLGGQDVNNALLEFWIEKFMKNHQKNLREYQSHLVELLDAIERVKKQLSYNMSITFMIDEHIDGIKFNETLSRIQLEFLIRKITDKIIPVIEAVFKEADLKKEDIPHVVLVGGSSRIPKYRATISKYFERQIKINAHPDEEIARGAGIISIKHTDDEFVSEIPPLLTEKELHSLQETQAKFVEEKKHMDDEPAHPQHDEL